MRVLLDVLRMAASSVSLWLLLPATVLAMQLPPEVQADRFVLQAERAMQEQDFVGAKAAMDAILELQTQHDLELPEEFSFRYAEVLERLGLYDEAIETVTRYLAAVGRDGQYYREALELLDVAEVKLSEEEAAERLAEAELARAERQQREREALVQRQIDTAGGDLPPDALQSGGAGPEMVIVASGRFEYRGVSRYLGQYQPPLWVEIDQSFAISKYEVTRGEFERFVDETRYRTEAESDPKHGCDAYNAGGLRKNDHRWNRHEYRQEDDHPVVCVSIRDALAYAAWLSRETGHTYRLPSSAEWEYAQRAGDPALMPIITSDSQEAMTRDALCNAGKRGCSSDTDWNLKTTPVGQFGPNRIGLYDMFGNALEAGF